MKGAGMLVFSLKGVNLGFWTHLRCSVQNAVIFSRKGLFLFYLRVSCYQSLFTGQKRLGHAQIGLL